MARIRTYSSILAIGAFTAVAVNAAAEDTKYKRQTQVKVDVKISDRVRPSTPTGDNQPKGPSITADEVLEIQGAVGAIREEQIQLLEGLIDETSDNDVAEKADLYFRLAEMHAQLNRYHRLKQTEAAIKADSAKGGDKAKLQAAAKDHEKQAKASLTNAVATYKKLTENDKFKNYQRMDQALFAFAYSLQQGKYMKDARQVYHRLLQDYPQSKYVPEAYLAFADYYFGANELANAEAFYQKVLQFPKSGVYNYANYMLGWVYLNLARHEDAGKQFLQVIRDTSGNKKAETLNKAAKKDFVRAFADFGQVQRAWQTFQKIDSAYALTMYTILADLYLEQGKNDRAIYAYRELIKQEPKDKNVCLWQYNIAHSMLSTPGANNADKVAEIERLTKLYGALKETKTLPPSESQECHDNAAAMSGEMARAWHNESIKTKNPETLAYADKLYNVYLAVFPDAEDYGETQYYYSELLWSRADSEPNPRTKSILWENAAVSFTNVVKTGKVDAKLLKESAYAAVLGWKNALAVDPRPKPGTNVDMGEESDKIPEPQPIPEREAKMLDAFDVYIKYIKDPKDDELVGMKFLKAAMYRRYNHYDEAIPIFEDIIKNSPQHETALYSAQSILDALIITHKYDEMLKWANYFSATPKFFTAKDDQDRSDLQERVADIRAKSQRKIAEALEKDAKASGDFQKYVACGNMYLEIFNSNPEAPKADEVLYNAGVCFEDGRALSTSIEAYTELRSRFPKSPQSAKALARLGGVYGRVAYYDRAATMFEEYAQKYAAEKDAYDLMSDAVFFRKGIGDDDKAIENTNYFIKKFASKKPADAAAAFFSLGSIYEKRGDLNKVVDHYRDYIKRYGEKGGADKVVVAYARIGQILWEQSCPVKTVDGSCIKVVRERAVSLRGKSKRKKGDATRTQCGPESKIKLTVVTRDPGTVKAALAAFKAAVGVYEKKGGKFPGGDERLAKYYYAMAQFTEAEVDYEKFLSVKFPEGMNFDPEKKAEAEKSLKRFDAWMKEKGALGAKASQQYQDLINKTKDPSNAIAAAARFGQISQNFSDALFTAEVPVNIRPYEEAVDIYCDTLTEKADPLEQAALNGFGACLKASTDFGWFSSWSKLCERELGQIKPEDFPSASELRAEPDRTAPVSDIEPPVVKLE